MRLRKLTRTSKTSSFLFSFIHSISPCINLVVFFFLDTSFFLFWTRSFKPGSLKTVFSKIFDDIWRRSWKTSQDIKSFRFLFLGKDWGITRLGPYIWSGFSGWGFLIPEKRIDHPTISTLASFSRFLFSTSCFLFFTSSWLKIQALWLSYWRQVCWARCFFHALATRSSVLVRFKITRSVIVSLSAFKVLFGKVSLWEPRVWWRNSNTSSSTSVTCWKFPGVGGIWPEKKRVQIGVLALGKVLFAVLVSVDSFWNTEDELYCTCPAARHADRMFSTEIPCRLAFYIKEIKSTLSIL